MKKNVFYPYETYIVRPDDTLNKIAHKYRIPLNLLMLTNPQIIKDKYITIGQIISIPRQIKNIPSRAISIPRQVLSIIAPKQLETIDITVGEIIDDINNQNWNEANSRLAIIKSNFDELKPMLEENLIPLNLIININEAIINLENAIASENVYESEVNANIISLYTSFILDFYETKLSTNIIRLKYLARSITLNAEVGNWNLVNNNFDFLNVVWNDLNPDFSSEYNQAILQFSEAIDSLGQAIENQDLDTTTNISNDILNQINLFEESYISAQTLYNF
ncbi:LysM repeat protein [Sedimentibacter acidaminivorans]|uniref:LysM repeat protein n=1 Tax=Sedimentibacter acidaminivorans TaxID=913099 RepID=A0ABS4GD26_9FIRM|nr:LysM domain-containing protein [Sedimentibacter acidaminivorans]MBP1925589.1 LysM repeat protein [Sedimentibacter acidaminivorans]